MNNKYFHLIRQDDLLLTINGGHFRSELIVQLGIREDPRREKEKNTDAHTHKISEDVYRLRLSDFIACQII